MSTQTKTLIAVGFVASIVIAAMLAWLYTRPVMMTDEQDDIRRRAETLARPRPIAGASAAPPLDCAGYVGRHPWGGEEVFPDPVLDARRARCARSFDAAWDHLLAAPDTSGEDVHAVADALAWDAQVRPAVDHVELIVRRLWSLDALVRSGQSDLLTPSPVWLGWLERSGRDGPLTADQAEHLRQMLARVQAHHANRLHRPELLALQLLDWSPSGTQDESLDWVCRERVVAVAEALDAIGCATLSTHACFDRVNATIDALDPGLRPEWAPWMPPRARRGWDAACGPLSAPLRELARRAVVMEIVLALMDEMIAHDLAGASVDATMSRPLPTFEGDPIIRRRGASGVVFEAPEWVGHRGEAVLSLPERYVPTPPPPPLFGPP